jgi:serine phosphatase RsbU (regulator of sigma subunit)
MTVGAEPQIGQADGATGRGEIAVAVISAAGLYVVGAALIATAAWLPHVSSAPALIAVAATALLTAAGLIAATSRGHAGLVLAFVADVWGIVLIVVLCAASGGARSPFALIYFFAIGHAAAFQPRRRFVLVSLAGLLAFLAPLAYEHVSTTFAATACVGMVLALLTCGVVHFALNRMRDQRRRLEFLIAATSVLDSSLDPDETLRKIAQIAVPELAELCVIDLVGSNGAIETTLAAAVDPAVAAEVERVRKEYPLDMRGPHPVARVLDSNEPYIIRDLTDQGARRQISDRGEDQRFMQDAGYGSAAVLPVVARGRTHGTISFLRVGTDVQYERDQLAILKDLTGRAAMAYDNARLYAERAHVARTLRRSLMPAMLPAIPGLDLAAYFRPMGAGNEVGGDFYDVFGDGRYSWLMVGDVCGSGADAAALTGFIRHTTIAYTREATNPAEVLAQVNQAMLDQDFEGRFATTILARVIVRGGVCECTIATAGHPAGLVRRAGGAVEELGESGTLLGIFPDPDIPEVSATLEAGDLLALYTDGLSEARAPDRTVSVWEMRERLRQSSPGGAQDAIDALLDLVELDDTVRDDIAILAVRVGEPTANGGVTQRDDRAPADPPR